MNQKKYLWTLLIVVVIIGALVAYRQWQMGTLTNGVTGELENGLLSEVQTVNGTKYLVPPSRVFDSGADLPALTDPAFTNVATADTYLSDAVSGISLEYNGTPYFFSYQIMNWHQVVNMTDAGIAVTHCMLCHSPAVYQTTDVFAHAGTVYNNNLLLSDGATGSQWSQMTGLAIVGERAGEELASYPFETMTWGEWKAAYPNGSVLSNATGLDRDYTHHPFENYDMAKLYYFPMNKIDERMQPKWLVDGFEGDENDVAFSRIIIQGVWVVNFTDADRSLTAFYDTQQEITRVFVAGEYTFTYDQEENVFVDQTGGTWSAQGVALTGSARGTQLTRLATQESFFMCWSATHTKTKIGSIDLIDTSTAPDDETAENAE